MTSIQNNPLANAGYTSPANEAGVPAGAQAKGATHLSNAEATALQNSLSTLVGQNKALDLPAPTTPSQLSLSERAAMELNSASNNVSADLMDFMAVFQKLAQEMRSAQREVRHAEMQAQVNTLLDAADQMKQAAAHRMTAAIVQGTMQVAAGAVQFGMSAGSAVSAVKGAQLQKTASNFSTKADTLKMQGNAADAPKVAGNQMSAAHWQQKATVANSRATTLDGLGRASAQSIGGLGSIVAAPIQYQADLSDARRAELDAIAKTHESATQQANEMMQQMQDIIRDVRDKLQSISQASIEANRGIARNI